MDRFPHEPYGTYRQHTNITTMLRIQIELFIRILRIKQLRKNMHLSFALLRGLFSWILLLTNVFFFIAYKSFSLTSPSLYTTVNVRPLKIAWSLFLWQCNAVLVVQRSTVCKTVITTGVRGHNYLPYWSNFENCCSKHSTSLAGFIPDKCYWLTDSECSSSRVWLFSRASCYFSRSKNI